jgi:aspartyl-tRNA(Asn)/glutamyl-tRNA(Gln) amidotransferase subunit A
MNKPVVRLHFADLAFQPAQQLRRLFEQRQLSPVELVEALLERIRLLDPFLHSYITVCGERALDNARRAEHAYFQGDQVGILHGIPVSHKDVIFTRGVRTTAHSRVLLDFVPKEDATAVRRLGDAGAILLGKTNTQEWACGGMEIFGIPRNPWDLTRYAGGSSGGSANAVAAGLAVVATGSDTGGSIRIPASMCGIVGLKPTFGRVSRYGLIPVGWSMDVIGPMARTVQDCALLLQSMSGRDERDPSTAKAALGNLQAPQSETLRGVVIGVPENHFFEYLEESVDLVIKAALRQLEDLGAHLVPIRLPTAGELHEVAVALTAVEAYAYHAQWLQSYATSYTPQAKRRIALGAFIRAADFQSAAQIRRVWIDELELVLRTVDAIATPTLHFAPYKLEVQESGNVPDVSRNTRHFNLSGHPALTIPCGFTDAGLPIGLQLASGWFKESVLLRIGHVYEGATAWHHRRPSLELAT